MIGFISALVIAAVLGYWLFYGEE